MQSSFPAIDSETEASHVAVQPAPGALFLSLRRERDGNTGRRMFVELTLGEALALRRQLDECIGIAAAAATP